MFQSLLINAGNIFGKIKISPSREKNNIFLFHLFCYQANTFDNKTMLKC